MPRTPQPTTTQPPTAARRRGSSVRARRSRRGRGGQTTIEFSFAFVLLLLGIFGAVSSAVWSIENMAAISANENALRILSAASGRNTASGTSNAGSAGALALINAKVVPALRPAMFGTQIQVGFPAGNVGGCPPGATPAAQIAAAAPSGPRVVICAQVVGGQVRVHIIGCAASMVPSAFGLTGCKWGVPVDDYGAVQALVFNT